MQENKMAIMLDIETLATPDKVLFPMITELTIVRFDMDSGEIAESIIRCLGFDDCMSFGFQINEDTLQFRLENGYKINTYHHKIDLFFKQINNFLQEREYKYIFTKYPHFDIGVLTNAYHKLAPDVPFPFEYYKIRCVKTWMEAKGIEMLEPNTHDSYKDCLNQIKSLTQKVK